MIGVPNVTPNTPKLVIVKVDPLNSSAVIVSSLVLVTISLTERHKPQKSFFFFAIVDTWDHQTFFY